MARAVYRTIFKARHFNKNGVGFMEIEVKSLPSLRVAFVRNLGPYETCHVAWEKLHAWAVNKKLITPETKWIGASYDDPNTTPPEQIRYDACMTVGPEVEAEGDIQVQELPGGDFIMTTHVGAFSKMGQTFQTLFSEGLAKFKREFRCEAPCLEFYIDDMEKVPEEKDRTELYAPVK
jgi:AraC family transcriptional regulator